MPNYLGNRHNSWPNDSQYSDTKHEYTQHKRKTVLLGGVNCVECRGTLLIGTTIFSITTLSIKTLSIKTLSTKYSVS